jgi:hypothetical protein
MIVEFVFLCMMAASACAMQHVCYASMVCDCRHSIVVYKAGCGVEATRECLMLSPRLLCLLVPVHR